MLNDLTQGGIIIVESIFDLAQMQQNSAMHIIFSATEIYMNGDHFNYIHLKCDGKN